MQNNPNGTSFWRCTSDAVLFCFLVISGFYFLTQHTAHVFGALPYLLLAACPLMHLFMHHGMAGTTGARPVKMRAARPIRGDRNDPDRIVRLWFVDPGRAEFGGVHHFRVQLRQAALPAGLTVVRRIQRVHRRSVRRNVRIPADDLFAGGTVADAISRRRPDVA